jgi:hypothetical protein
MEISMEAYFVIGLIIYIIIGVLVIEATHDGKKARERKEKRDRDRSER